MSGLPDPAEDFRAWLEAAQRGDEVEQNFLSLRIYRGHAAVVGGALLTLARLSAPQAERGSALLFSIAAVALLWAQDARKLLTNVCHRARTRLEARPGLPEPEEHFALAALHALIFQAEFLPSAVYQQYIEQVAQCEAASRPEQVKARIAAAYCRSFDAILPALQDTQGKARLPALAAVVGGAEQPVELTDEDLVDGSMGSVVDDSEDQPGTPAKGKKSRSKKRKKSKRREEASVLVSRSMMIEAVGYEGHAAHSAGEAPTHAQPAGGEAVSLIIADTERTPAPTPESLTDDPSWGHSVVARVPDAAAAQPAPVSAPLGADDPWQAAVRAMQGGAQQGGAQQVPVRTPVGPPQAPVGPPQADPWQAAMAAVQGGAQQGGAQQGSAQQVVRTPVGPPQADPWQAAMAAVQSGAQQGGAQQAVRTPVGPPQAPVGPPAADPWQAAMAAVQGGAQQGGAQQAARTPVGPPQAPVGPPAADPWQAAMAAVQSGAQQGGAQQAARTPVGPPQAPVGPPAADPWQAAMAAVQSGAQQGGAQQAARTPVGPPQAPVGPPAADPWQAAMAAVQGGAQSASAQQGGVQQGARTPPGPPQAPVGPPAADPWHAAMAAVQQGAVGAAPGVQGPPAQRASFSLLRGLSTEPVESPSMLMEIRQQLDRPVGSLPIGVGLAAFAAALGALGLAILAFKLGPIFGLCAALCALTCVALLMDRRWAWQLAIGGFGLTGLLMLVQATRLSVPWMPPAVLGVFGVSAILVGGLLWLPPVRRRYARRSEQWVG